MAAPVRAIFGGMRHICTSAIRMVAGGLLALLAMILFAAPAAAQTIVASSASPSTYSGSGQTITFSFTVNSGNRVASSATVTSSIGLVYTCPIADTVNTNVNFTCTATYTTTGSDAFNGGFVQDQPTVTMMSFSTPSTIAVPAMRSDYVAPDSPPVILFDPLDAVVTAGNNATFDAFAAGKPTPSVQWQVSTNGGGTFNNISGATSDILTFATTAADNGNQYRVVYTNYLGSATTAAATLSIQGAPVITTQPVGGTAAPGSSIPLSAAATGSPTPTASWSISEDNGATYQFVSSALSFSLDSSSPKVILAKVVFTNTAGSVTSDVVTLTWAMQNQTISFTSSPPASAVVGGATYTVAATATSGLAVSYSIDPSASNVCSIAGSTVSFQGIGTCTINANQAGNTAYNAAPQVQQTFAVGQGANIITFPALSDTLFTATPPALSATASSGLAISYASNSTSVCTVSGGAISFVTAGTCSVTASQAGDSNFAVAAPVTNTFVVTPGTNTITFPALADTAFTSAPPALVATASSGLAISYNSNSTGICTVSGGTISFVTAGTCSVTASQAGDSNFAAAAPVTNTFAVTPGSNTITFPALTDTAFTSTPPVLVATASSGLAISYTSNSAAICTVSGGTISFVTAGTCSVTASQAGDSNFGAATPVTNTFAVTPGTNTITFPALTDTAFTSAPPALVATASSGLPISYGSNSTSICTVSGGAISFVTAGTCSVTASQAGDSNFAAAAPVTNTFAVTPGSNTITFPALADTAFTSAPPALVATASSGLAISYTSNSAAICTVSGGTISFVTAGTCSVTASQAGDSNFAAASPATNTFAVTPGTNTITFAALPTRPLGSGSFALTATASSGLPISYASATPAICSVSGGAVNLLAVGTCTVLANQAGNADFQAAPQISQSFEIAPAATTVGLTSSASTVFFGVPVTLTATVSGVSPTGTVEFNDGTTMLGTATLSGGSASITTSALAAGARQLTANYLGDASNLPGTSDAISVTVNARPNPAQDPDTRSSIDSQFRTAERFARTQMTNVENRLSQLHSDGEGQDSMNLRFSQTLPQWRDGLPGQNLQSGTVGYGHSYSNAQLLSGGGAMLAAFDPNAPRLPGAPLGMTPVAMDGSSGGKNVGPRHAAGESLERRAFRIWASGDVNFGKEQPNGAVEQRFTSSGITVGVDGKIGSDLKLGAAFGFAWDHTRIGTNGSENDATNGSLTFYGSWRAAPKLFIDGLVGKGYGTIDTTRFSSTGAVFLDGERDSEQTFAALIGTYEAKLGSGIEFAPYLRADGIWVHLSPYTEAGSPFWALVFQAADGNSFSGTAGARARFPLGKESDWKLTSKAEYRTRISGDYTQLLDFADIQGVHGSPFAITGQGVNSSTFTGGLGIEGNLHNLMLRLNYDLTTLAGGNISNRISGAVMWQF